MMKSAFVVAVLLCVAFTSPVSAGTISGELVVTNAASNQFRIVDHGGGFRAPAGMNIQALDGKPVIVELGANREVLRITENPIPIDPVTSQYEVITGELVLVDAARGLVTVAGLPQTYSAARGIDLTRYAGQRVELFVDQRGEVLEVRPVGYTGGAIAGDAVVPGHCSYNGRGYDSGATLCQTGTQHRCEQGQWRSLGIPCGSIGDQSSCVSAGTAFSDGSTRCENGVRFVCDDGRWQYVNRGCGEDAHSARAADAANSCVLGGASLANGSSICRDGVTFRCSGGMWQNVRTACR